MCTSVTARIYDIPGKLAPLTLRLKHDLRKLIDVDPDWDSPISFNFRERWIQNFKMIEEMRDVQYQMLSDQLSESGSCVTELMEE